MAKTRDYMDYLDANIEIAPANSQEEYQAAETIADVMRDHGVEPSIEEFDAHPWGQSLPAVLALLMLVAMVVAGLTEGIVHIVALAVAVVGVGVLLLNHFVRNVFEGVGPAVRSQNVVAVHRASGDKVVKGARPIVIVAHYDTPRESLLRKGPLAQVQPTILRMAIPCAIVVAVTLVVQAMGFLPGVIRTFAWVVGLIAALPLAFVAIATLVDRRMACTIGANDNKASVAALLSVLDKVRPGEDRVGDDTGEGASARQRAVDRAAQRAAQAQPRFVEVVEEVKGVRHGAEMLEALGILPATCEVIYEEPKVRVVEEQSEAVPGDYDEMDKDAWDDEYESQDEGRDYIEEDADVADEFESEGIDYDEPEENFDEEDAYEADDALNDEPDESDEYQDEQGYADYEDEEDYEVAEEDEYDEEYLDEDEFDEESFDEFDEDYDDEEYEEGPGILSGVGAWFSERLADIKEFFSSNRGEDIELDYGEDRTGEDYDDEDAEDLDEWDDEDAAEDYDDETEYEDDVDVEEVDDLEDEYDALDDEGFELADDEDEESDEQDVTLARVIDVPGADLEWDDAEDDLLDDEDEDAELDEYEDLVEEDADFAYDDDEEYADDDDRADEDDFDEYGEDEFDEDEFTEENDEEEEPLESADDDDDYNEWIDYDEEDDFDEEDAENTAHPTLGERLKSMFSRMRGTEPVIETESEPYEEDDPYKEEDADEEEYDDEFVEEDVELEDESLVAEYAGEAYEYDDYDEFAELAEYEESFEGEEEDGVELVERPSDPNELHFDREEDADIVPRDTTGLDTISDSYDLYEGDEPIEPVIYEKPEPIDDPNWGVSSYQPARPVINIARRAALFDLPDPSASFADPLANDDYDEDYDDAFEDEYVYEEEPAVEEEVVAEEAPVADEQPNRGQSSFWGDASTSAPADWKGGAALRADLREDENGDPIVIDANELQDAILEMGDEFLIAHDIWFVATGGSAFDHAGIKAFLDEHRRDIRGSFLINLESVGAGTLSVIVREGLHAPRRADRRLVRMLTNIAEDLHIPLDTAIYDWDECESATAMRSRVRSVTIMGMDENNLPALSHTSEDIPDNVNPNQVSSVVQLITELIRRS